MKEVLHWFDQGAGKRKDNNPRDETTQRLWQSEMGEGVGKLLLADPTCLLWWWVAPLPRRTR